MPKIKVLICTGFHRSATSATANYLNNAGLDLGSNLMVGNISNVKGHFEDWDAVLLHDEQLVDSTTSWQFHDECELSPEPNFLSGYIKQRSEQNLPWGVKDPRACLFLNEWKKALGDSGYYLFVVRHWSSCIESLLHRHSRDLAYALPELDRDSIGAQFWIQPELAAKMWLAYNKRLVKFAKENSDLTLVVTQRAVFEGVPIIETINNKFGFDLDENVESPFDASLFRDKASKTVFSQLSRSLQVKLNAVWAELLDLVTFKSDDESPIIVAEFIDNELSELVTTQIEKIVVESLSNVTESVETDKQSTVPYTKWQTDLSELAEPAEVVSYLDKTPAKMINEIEPNNWLAIVDGQFSLNGQVLLSIAKLSMRMKKYELAINYFQKAVSVGVYFPYVDMMIAQCKQALEQCKEAEFFFNKAIKANPNNPVFYTNYAKLLVTLRRTQEAKQQFELGMKKGPNQPFCLVAYCDFLSKESELNKAIFIAEQFIIEKEHPSVQNLLARLRLQQNAESGKQYYRSQVADKLKDKDTIDWLAKSCLLIDSSIAEQDFINRCLGHWKLLNDK
ncbi:tetratricopeptide repeat protein [Psychromonas hadalis]|uniref:tetratricopeptide repeat protein n=1 Tax=Psychromonas hadalis TaxID=211669 RepID=UPI0003B4A9CE|nr:tetratricopeptide repeat protein [Psychromonas hadalis]